MVGMAAQGKMVRTVRMEKMAKMVEMAAMGATVIGDVEEMAVTEETLINLSSSPFSYSKLGGSI